MQIGSALHRRLTLRNQMVKPKRAIYHNPRFHKDVFSRLFFPRGAMMLGLLCVGVLEGATGAGKVSDGVYFSALNNFTIPVP